jgi:hypothetical protein
MPVDLYEVIDQPLALSGGNVTGKRAEQPTPSRYAVATTATRACSARRRWVSSQSGKNEPCRSFGIASSTVPARVSPLPSPVAVARVRPLGAALAPGGAADLVGLRGHHRVRERRDHLAQQIEYIYY